MQKLKNVYRYDKLSDMPFDQRSLIHREAWFPPCFVRQNQQKKHFYLRGDFWQFSNKNVQMLDHFFQLLFPKDSESLKILDIPLCEVGAKRRLNGTSKVNTHTDKQTDGQTDRRIFRLIERIGPEGRCFENRLSMVLRRSPREAGGGQFKFPPQAPAAAETFIAACTAGVKLPKLCWLWSGLELSGFGRG